MLIQHNNISSYGNCQDINSKLQYIKLISKVNPQKENGFTEICNEFLESLYKIKYKSAYTLPIVLVIIRKTWGWHKIEDSISISQIEKETKYPIKAIKRSLKEAEALGIIFSAKNKRCY